MKTQFMHITTSVFGGVTLAIRRVEGSDDIVEYEVGAAFASPLDSFNRRRGRLIAEGRLNAKRHGWISFVRTEKDKKESITKKDMVEYLPQLRTQRRKRVGAEAGPDWYPTFLTAVGAR